MGASAVTMPDKPCRDQSLAAKFRRKAFLVRSLEEMTDRVSNGAVMARNLTLLDLLLLGIGCVIGSGVVVLTGVAARLYAGPAVVLSFALGGLVALIAGLCYAEYAADIPISGGASNFIGLTFGEFPAWVAGCDLILEYTLGAATIAKGFTSYFASLCGIPLNKIQFNVGLVTLDPISVVVIVISTLLLAKGNRESKIFNNAMVIVHLLLIAFIIFAGFPFADASNYVPFAPFGLPGVFTGAAIVFFSFTGFETVACMTEEANNPKRDIPIALVGSISVCTAIYITMCLCITGMQKYTIIDLDAPFSVAFVALGMDWASRIVAIGAIFGIVTSLLGNLIGQSRIYITLGRQNLLPAWLAQINTTTETPLNSLFLTCVLASLCAFFIDLELLSEFVSMGTLVVLVMICSGILYRRYTLEIQTESRSPVVIRMVAICVSAIGFSFSFMYEAHLAVPCSFIVLWLGFTMSFLMLPVKYVPEGFKTPWNPFIPSLGVFFSLHLIGSLGWVAYVRWIVWFIVGTVFYLCYGLHRTKEEGAWEENQDHEKSVGRGMRKVQTDPASINNLQLVRGLEMSYAGWVKPSSLTFRRSEIIPRDEHLKLDIRNSM